MKIKIALEIEKIILNALAEDIGEGDVTTNCTVPPGLHFTGEFIAKENGVIAGLGVLKKVFTILDTSIVITTTRNEGDPVRKGEVFAKISGNAAAILSGERVALNFLQRMSGIATLSRKFTEAVKGTSAKILDTRKTAPGLRILDKQAVAIGGGQNHRMGLDDMVMIKENHITVAGGITNAVERVREKDAGEHKIEVEVTNFLELKEALRLKVDRILLDNMSVEELRKSVEITDGQTPLEASGNVSLETVNKIAKTGVDFISIGKLTHSVKALDISLELREKKDKY